MLLRSKKSRLRRRPRGAALTSNEERDLAPDIETGFTNVDAQPDPSMLVAGMEATAQWSSVRRLRAWEHEQLDLRPGESLLDVGCGIADVALALADDLAPGGRIAGIDASGAMLAVAAARTSGAPVPITYDIGDATALALDDATFDACRSERMLQWVPEPATAVAEMVRVVRPGGRISLIDSDWRTFAADVTNLDDHDLVVAGLRALRPDAFAVGGQLVGLALDAGLADVRHVSATHTWTEWDPDVEPGPPGLFPLRPAIGRLSDVGLVPEEVTDRYVDDLEHRARNGRLFLSLTMFAVAARVPG
jgi:SAM-dependent methyltransferase